MRREIQGEIKRIRMELEGLRDLTTISPELYSVPDFYRSGVESWSGELQIFEGKKSKKRKKRGSEAKPRKLRKHEFDDYCSLGVYRKPYHTLEFTGFEGERRRRTKKRSNKKNYRKRQGRRTYGYWDPFDWDYV